jgi:hypothetical protein
LLLGRTLLKKVQSLGLRIDGRGLLCRHFLFAAVHGNDSNRSAKQPGPYRQIVTIGSIGAALHLFPFDRSGGYSLAGAWVCSNLSQHLSHRISCIGRSGTFEHSPVREGV